MTLADLKMQYTQQDIPTEKLTAVINQAIVATEPKRKRLNWWQSAVIGVGAVAAAFTLALNTSYSFANASERVPVVRDAVKVLLFREYKHVDKTSYADIKVPLLTNLRDRQLSDKLNTAYAEEGRALYESFMNKTNDTPKSMTQTYDEKVNNSQLLVLERRQDISSADTATKLRYTTIDKQNGLVVTLPMLFKANAYQTILKNYVNEQIAASKQYDTPIAAIGPKQTFYINNKGELVLVFQRGEIAPMYVGAVAMTIPTDEIDSQLISHAYVK
ncbi:RsiV family protein [Weissella cibaria]|uniref:DUF3298 domain-containing protein n=1 Tax=Weissella cibaria TaxID=137591 RepID=A0A9Q8N9P2_9LACO|nr:RsiV family protein [Weissella cibaria]TVV28363.1 DUF3298 domain-containing protein [Weissella cibaria]TVV41556.1 DUF3298 domain-containing protein [Weissella cibaria]